MGEWEKGLEVARERGLIDENLRDRLSSLEFEREASVGKFPMRIALFVLGAILLVSAGFAVLVRVLGEDPSEFLVSAILIIVAIIAETIARLVQRAKVLTFLAGIIGTFAGLPLGFSLAILLPGEPNSGALALGFFVAALWSGYWFRRTKSGLAISAVVLELGGSIIAIGEVGKVSSETTGVALCVLGVAVAVFAILGRLKPSPPPLVASLIVIGWGCAAQNSFGVDVIAVVGLVLSAGLFLLSYRRSEAIMSAATAVSTGIWAVVLTTALTDGSIAPLIVAAVLGAALIAWSAKLTRK